jgi:GT2 family glycosyltransferase
MSTDRQNNDKIMVDCILVNYRSPWRMIDDCLESIVAGQDETGCRVILVDNASGDDIPQRVRSRYPQARVMESDENLGFAAAVNIGLRSASSPYVLMLNTDAVLTPGALTAMVHALEAAGESCAGVAPKMMSSAHSGLIDAVGIVVPPTGDPFNRGIGQCDLGQYDISEEVAGACFGAALLRRSMEPEKVGPLYEGYFLYFEDSDWCVRAVSRGYRFITVPEAVVMHQHSGVTRHESLEFKYYLIELNTLKMVTRNFQSVGYAGRIVASRCLRLLARTFIRRRFISANLRVIAAYLTALPRLLKERRRLQSDRMVPDSVIFHMAEGEEAFFDTVAYSPDRCLDSLISSYRRLLGMGDDEHKRGLLSALRRFRDETAEGRRPDMDEALAPFKGEPPCVRELLRLAAVSQARAPIR